LLRDFFWECVGFQVGVGVVGFGGEGAIYPAMYAKGSFSSSAFLPEVEKINEAGSECNF
jgi:hypothetical protein